MLLVAGHANFAHSYAAGTDIQAAYQPSTMASIQKLAKASVSPGGAVVAKDNEVELKRLVSVNFGPDAHDCFLTLTNTRLLIRSAKGGSPRQILLSDIVKAKTQSGGFFSSKKPTTKITLKTVADEKYEIDFKEAFLSIVPAIQERDEFCQLIMDHVKNVDESKVVSP